MCADPIIYCLVQEIPLFLLHQMILLTIVKKLFNSSHIHAFYVFCSLNFIAHLSSEKSSRKISNRNFSKPSLTFLRDFMSVYILMFFVVLFRLSKGSWRIRILLSCAQSEALYIQSHSGQLCIVHEVQTNKSWFNDNNMVHMGQVQFVKLCTE